MYIKIIIHTSLYLFNLSLNVYFLMFVNSQKSLVNLHMVLQQTHLRKDTGQFVNDRSRQTHVRPLSCMFFFFVFLNVSYL